MHIKNYFPCQKNIIFSILLTVEVRQLKRRRGLLPLLVVARPSFSTASMREAIAARTPSHASLCADDLLLYLARLSPPTCEHAHKREMQLLVLVRKNHRHMAAIYTPVNLSNPKQLDLDSVRITELFSMNISRSPCDCLYTLYYCQSATVYTSKLSEPPPSRATPERAALSPLCARGARARPCLHVAVGV